MPVCIPMVPLDDSIKKRCRTLSKRLPYKTSARREVYIKAEHCAILWCDLRQYFGPVVG